MPVSRNDFASLVVKNAGLSHGKSDSHCDASYHLAIIGQAAHYPATVIGAQETENFDFAGFHVHGDLAELGDKGIYCPVCRIRGPITDTDYEAMPFQS